MADKILDASDTSASDYQRYQTLGSATKLFIERTSSNSGDELEIQAKIDGVSKDFPVERYVPSDLYDGTMIVDPLDPNPQRIRANPKTGSWNVWIER